MTENFRSVKLFGRVIITANIRTLTGLHIGGSSSGMEIGGVDNPVIRDPLTNRPYIPGSSLRGKMRSLLEKTLALPQNNKMGKDVWIHTCKESDEYEKNGGCPVCHIFGVPGESNATGSTLLVVRDIAMQKESADRLMNVNTDMAYTELKTEVSIDRVTSAASPRTLERVPADTVFGPAEWVFSFYGEQDLKFFKNVVDGLQLIEDDYIGGSGTRGSGKVAFVDIKMALRNSQDYSHTIEYQTSFANLADFIKEYKSIQKWINLNLFGS